MLKSRDEKQTRAAEPPKKEMQMKRELMTSLMILGVAFAAPFAHANDDSKGGLKEDIKEGARDVKKGVKKGYRAAKDKTCEVVNGKMECAAKKVKHKVQNAGDEIKDKVE